MLIYHQCQVFRHMNIQLCTHGGGTEYTTGYSYDGTPGTDGKLTFVITNSTPTTLYYYCSSHPGMGGTINIVLGSQSGQVEFTETQ
jgi:plastocyanin